MIRPLLKIAASALWLGSIVFLTLTDVQDHRSVRIAAAVIVGIPGMLTFASGVGDLFGKPKASLRKRVKRTLQSSINQIYREKLYPDDITGLSFHVWTVPEWYRKLPYRVRRRVKPDHRKMPSWLRPRLQRTATFRWEHHSPSGITFRKGVGVVGRCIDLNQGGKIMHVLLDEPKFQNALRQGEANWHTQPINITQNLRYGHAVSLAASYGQVAAMVIRETSGEAIGCITLDVPPAATMRLRRPAAKRLLEVLTATAEHVENHLTSRTDND